MTNLHDARVTAAAKAMEKLPLNLVTRAEAVEAAMAAIAAADAVVTVEEVAAALRTVTDVHHPDQCDCTDDEVCDGAWDEARAVLALIRGGEER